MIGFVLDTWTHTCTAVVLQDLAKSMHAAAAICISSHLHPRLGPMSPKKKVKGTGGVVATTSVTAVDGGTSRAFQDLRAKICDHASFKGQNYMRPVKHGNDTCAAFDLESFKYKMTAGEPAHFLGNIFWISDASCSNIPIRTSALMAEVQESYPEPHVIEEVITIAIPDAGYNPLGHLGELAATSPEEHRLSILKAVERDLAEGDTTKIKSWAYHLCRIPMKFVLMPNEVDRHFDNVAAREQATRRFHLLARSQYGRMLEVWNFRASLPNPISAKDLAKLYAEKGKMSSKSDPVTDSFIDNCVTVMSRVVALFPEVRAELEAADDEYNMRGPLHEISKLLSCVQKSSSGDLIKWTILGIHDQFRCGMIPKEGISVRGLAGTKGEKGFIDLMHFRHCA